MIAMPGMPRAYTPIVCVFELGVIDEQPSCNGKPPPEMLPEQVHGRTPYRAAC